jgi:AraC-like DNA-binding protein
MSNELPYPKMYLYRRLVQAKLFIDAHYNEQINLEMIADEACFSRFHFIRLFKDVFGKTPHQYLIALRLVNARSLFEQGGTVADVCYEVGFESITSFSGLFKKRFGITISQFIVQHQKHRQLVSERPLQFVPGCHARWFSAPQ